MTERSITLAGLRNRRNITQRQLARELSKNREGVKFSQSVIASYELGLRTPSLQRAKLIAKYFGVPVEAIIFAKIDRESQSVLAATGTEGGN